MKNDIDRKDKEQASVIDSQAKRLEELEKLYKDEQVGRRPRKVAGPCTTAVARMLARRQASAAVAPSATMAPVPAAHVLCLAEQVARKRAFNMIEDLKGKIRVYCRVRPILNFEKDKGQVRGGRGGGGAWEVACCQQAELAVWTSAAHATARWCASACAALHRSSASTSPTS